MFLFVAPWLYIFHAFLDGVSFLVADLLNISIGNTFSGGFIDFFLFGVLQGNSKTNWVLVPLVGAAWFALYYFSFRFLITKFNVMTPGRADDETIEDTKSNLVSKESLKDEAVKIIAALGTAENIEEVDACITRLRVSIKDSTKVDKAALKALGATDVLEVKGGIQAIYGAKAILYKNHIAEILNLDD
jgi:PTS system glucose-specific IIC component